MPFSDRPLSDGDISFILAAIAEYVARAEYYGIGAVDKKLARATLIAKKLGHDRLLMEHMEGARRQWLVSRDEVQK